MPVVDELVTLLGLETDPAAKGEAKSFEGAVKGVRKAALAAGAALVAFAGTTFAISKQFASAADETGKFAASNDISIKKLQELEFAYSRVGGTSADLRGDLEGLTQKFGSADKGIDALIKQFEGLTDIQAKLAGVSFGISESAIRLLRRGTKGIEEMRAEFRALGGGLPEEATVRAEEFNHQWLNLTTTIRGISGLVQTALLPTLTQTTQALRQILVGNRELIASGLTVFVTGVQKGFADFGSVLEVIGDYLWPLFDGLGDVAGGLDTVDTIANLVIGTLTVLSVLLIPLVIKLALIAAAAVVLGLAIDDLITFFKGGDSVIGRFFEGFEERFPALTDMVRSAAEVFSNWFSEIVAKAKVVADAIRDMFPDLDGILGKIKSIFTLPGQLGIGLDILNKGAELLGFGEDSPSARSRASAAVPASTVNNTTNNSSSQGQTTTININGAGDPRGVAAEVMHRGGLGATTQVLSPGPRAPRIV